MLSTKNVWPAIPEVCQAIDKNPYKLQTNTCIVVFVLQKDADSSSPALWSCLETKSSLLRRQAFLSSPAVNLLMLPPPLTFFRRQPSSASSIKLLQNTQRFKTEREMTFLYHRHHFSTHHRHHRQACHTGASSHRDYRLEL
ncbi:hypothetical protein F2Q70_00018370 [Brassica cretica]|uniref:Uncharacterized protein n=1 Tax=Brassica cretica TaxID=69181 RepID=A0A3N6RVB8_BRACR|nr:hypothetical protein F2Q70_00018370 [Brassica cretica]KAF2597856.1 hypothetical protein F2Q68_00011635 [Brassica cretica]